MKNEILLRLSEINEMNEKILQLSISMNYSAIENRARVVKMYIESLTELVSKEQPKDHSAADYKTQKAK